MKKFALMAAFSAFLLTGTATYAADEPRSGGVINFVAPYGDSFSSLDIHASPATQDEFYAKAIHRTLYDWDANENTPVLGLATDVSVSDDKLTYTYKLRDDAHFHNGKQLTADDIIWSYTRMMDPKRAFPPARYIAEIQGADEYSQGAADSISGLKKIDDHTLEITLKQPINPSFLFMRNNTAIYPDGEGDSEEFQRNPIGLGPYKFAEYVPGSRLTVEKWDKYYEDGKPYADKINIMIMGDAAARDVAFRNKEIDVAVLGSAQYVAYQQDPELSKNLLEVAEVYTRMVGFNPDHEPFKDKRVRQAINYAIDSDLIIKRLVKDKAYRAVGWLPNSSPAFDKNAKPYPYDPEKAKALLAEAGYPDGFEFELTATQNESWGLTIVEAIIPMLDKVGIKVKAKPVEASVLSEVVPGGDFQAFMWSLESGPDPLTSLQCFHSQTPQSSCNYQKFSNAEFDKLIDDAKVAETEEKKNDLLRQANNLLQEEAPVWFFNYNKAVMAYQPWLHGLQPNSAELAIQSYEDLWLDENVPAGR
ncbi:ABC transporter substrate-binding protein [Falsochrobactrum ovis]|uniref:Peptide/nickel transport system substrate-binding protein n=1 Tax=Falsochrobactrum ovis TaxID=1293442 RepID=A0A364JWG5_9HYPH|nr:ABC transporter substrate-binding protein [Falsochrobactrum ovis]RAK30984.1 peptide/nickel transport system substrate-binding protein [Falsochrobactrum ovis]